MDLNGVVRQMSSATSRVVEAAAPVLDLVDSSVSLLWEGYRFGSRRFARAGADLFDTRLMLTRATFTYGEEAARHFYTPDRLTRKGALPLPNLALLQDVGSVQVLDGAEHRHRKAMFLSMMTPAALDELVALFEQEWGEAERRWAAQEHVVLLDAVHEVLCRTVCAWSGVPLAEEEVPERTRQLVSMFEGAGAFGPRNWRGQLLRHSAEKWVRGLVDQVRSGRLDVDDQRPLRVVATHRGLDGNLLSTAVAAVELINVLRPTVAIGRFIVFAALALHEHPEQRARLTDDDALRAFAQEVRRFYAFFPVVGGRVAEEFVWRDRSFRRGEWLLLDLYATNHDARIWGDPEVFRPERFRERSPGPFDLVPQGGGDHAATHRCAGEWPTVRLLERAVGLLAELSHDVPPQDLTVDLTQMPTSPRSGMVVHVRA
ncbi:cytochrome P450 [Blastococcus deserti]|uniref:Cytochrome P450 n=1 Tax=Blastococcus deserti TaxID=2259033 RepID=A0ABW4X9C9_9ACTN